MPEARSGEERRGRCPRRASTRWACPHPLSAREPGREASSHGGSQPVNAGCPSHMCVLKSSDDPMGTCGPPLTQDGEVVGRAGSIEPPTTRRCVTGLGGSSSFLGLSIPRGKRKGWQDGNNGPDPECSLTPLLWVGDLRSPPRQPPPHSHTLPRPGCGRPRGSPGAWRAGQINKAAGWGCGPGKSGPWLP